MVQMRPQFHHIDALAEQVKATLPREGAARQQEARAIHMTVKSSIDGEEDTTDTMAERISAAQAEAWKHHRYVDEDMDDAWAAFDESLFVGGNREMEDNDSLLDKFPRLRTSLEDDEYLDAISAPGDEARLSRSQKTRKGKAKDKKGRGPEEVVGGSAEQAENSSGPSDSGSDTEMENTAPS
jgi:DNA-directed RNA polymerase-3 subunit RPC5